MDSMAHQKTGRKDASLPWLDHELHELTSSDTVVAAVHRISNRMEVVLINTFDGKQAPVDIGNTTTDRSNESASEGRDNSAKLDLCDAPETDRCSDYAFCSKVLPMASFVLCAESSFTDNFGMDECGRFLRDILKFCVKMMDHVEELIDVVVLLLGGFPDPPTWFVERLCASDSSNWHDLRVAIKKRQHFLHRHGTPSSTKILGSIVWYWPDDHKGKERAASTLLGRDVKKRFRRYVNNGTGGWFSGVIESYDAESNVFFIAFEDGDRKAYDLDENSVDFQVCPLQMCYDQNAYLSMDMSDAGKRIQVFHAKRQIWMRGWIEKYENQDGTHLVRFDDERDLSGGLSLQYEGNLVIVDFKDAVQYRLLRNVNKDIEAKSKKRSKIEFKGTWSTKYVLRPEPAGNSPSIYLLANIGMFCKKGGYNKLFKYMKSVSNLNHSKRPAFSNICKIVSCVAQTSELILPSERVLGHMSELLRRTSIQYAKSLSDDELRHVSQNDLKLGIVEPVRKMVLAAQKRMPEKEKIKLARRLYAEEQGLKYINAEDVSHQVSGDYAKLSRDSTEGHSLDYDYETQRANEVFDSALIEISHLELSMIWKRLQSHVLGQRLSGMSELENYIRNVQVLSASNSASDSYRGISKSWLRDWILKQKIVEDIFGSRLDVRCVERAGKILTFLAEEHAVQSSHFETIWRACSSGYHESTRIAIYDFIVDNLSQSLGPEQRLEFFSRYVSQTPFHAYDDMFIQFLQKFTKFALHADEQIRQIVDSDKDNSAVKNTAAYLAESSMMQEARRQLKIIQAHPKVNSYGINLLWEFLQDAPTSRRVARNPKINTPESGSLQKDACNIVPIKSKSNFVDRPLTASCLGRSGGRDIVPPPANMDFDIAQEAINILTNLLKMQICEKRNYRKRIIQKCVACLQEGNSVPQALDIMVRIIKIYPVRQPTAHIRSESVTGGKESSLDDNRSSSGESISSKRRWFRRNLVPRRPARENTKKYQKSKSSKLSSKESNASGRSDFIIWADQSRQDIIDSFLLNRHGNHPNLLEMFFDELRVYCSRVATAVRESQLKAEIPISHIKNSTSHRKKPSSTFQAAADFAESVVVESSTPRGIPENLSSSTNISKTSSKVTQRLSNTPPPQDRSISENILNEFRLPSSCYSHLSQIKARLNFLLYVLKNASTVILRKGHTIALWECLVTQALTDASRDLAFGWFCSILDPYFVDHNHGEDFIPVQICETASLKQSKDSFGKMLAKKTRDGMHGKLTGKINTHKIFSNSDTGFRKMRNFSGFIGELVADLRQNSKDFSNGRIASSTGKSVNESTSKGISKTIMSIATIACVLVDPSMVPSLHVSTLSHRGWNLILRYFLVVNITEVKALALHPIDSKQIIRTGFKLFGIDLLWSVALHSTDILVARSAMKLLRLLHTSLPTTELSSVNLNTSLTDSVREITKKINEHIGLKTCENDKGKKYHSRPNSLNCEDITDFDKLVHIHFALTCFEKTVSVFKSAVSQNRFTTVHESGQAEPRFNYDEFSTEEPEKDPMGTLSLSPNQRDCWSCLDRGLSLLSQFLSNLYSSKKSYGKSEAHLGTFQGKSHLIITAMLRYLKPKDDMSLTFASTLKKERARQKSRSSSFHDKGDVSWDNFYLYCVAEFYIDDLFRILDYVAKMENFLPSLNLGNSFNSPILMDNVWNILYSLPVDLELALTICELKLPKLSKLGELSSVESQGFLGVLLDPGKSLSRLTYSLQIINGYMTNQAHGKRSRSMDYAKWCRNLIQVEAASHFCHILDELCVDNENPPTFFDMNGSWSSQYFHFLCIFFHMLHNFFALDPNFKADKKLDPSMLQDKADLTPGILLAIVNMRKLVRQTLQILLHLIKNVKSDEVSPGQSQDAFPLLSGEQQASELSSTRSVRMMLRSLCVDCGMRLIVASCLTIDYSNQDSCDKDSSISAIGSNRMLLEEFMEASLLNCPVKTIRNAVVNGLERLCSNDVSIRKSRASSGCPPYLGSSEALLNIFSSRRFFHKVINERRNWLSSQSNRGICRHVNGVGNSAFNHVFSAVTRKIRQVQNSCEYWNALSAAICWTPNKIFVSELLVKIALEILDQSCRESFVVGSMVDDVFVGLCKVCCAALTYIRKNYKEWIKDSEMFDEALRKRLLNHLWTMCLFPEEKKQRKKKAQLDSSRVEESSSSSNSFTTLDFGIEISVCASDLARKAAFKVIRALLHFSVENQSCSNFHNSKLFLHFGDLLLNQSILWDRLASNSWSYDVTTNTARENNGFVGLKNQGATCYMNSLLQQLFHISSFRSGMLQIESEVVLTSNEGQKNVSESSAASSTLFQLQVLFGNLLLSQKASYDTRPFCDVLREPGGLPLRLDEQKDANEFCGVLFDLLEEAHPQAKQLLQSHFYGKFVHEIISKDPLAPYTSAREEAYFMITVPVKNKDTLEEGLELLTQSEILSGENQYQVPAEAGFGSDKKVDASKSMSIRSLPPFLIFHLKRFEFDYEKMRKVKINDEFSFPQRLNMYPYTTHAVNAERLAKQKESVTRRNMRKSARSSNNLNGANRTGTLPPPAPSAANTSAPPLPASLSQSKHFDDGYEQTNSGKFVNNSFHYVLRGVVAHTGTVDSGHYYSFIRTKERDPFIVNSSITRTTLEGSTIEEKAHTQSASSTNDPYLNNVQNHSVNVLNYRDSTQSDRYSTRSSLSNTFSGSTIENSDQEAIFSGQSRDELTWFEFNDKHVHKFSLDRLADECFGGSYIAEEHLNAFPGDVGLEEVRSEEERSEQKDFTANMQTHNKKGLRVKQNNAYMLVYEQVHIDQFEIGERDVKDRVQQNVGFQKPMLDLTRNFESRRVVGSAFEGILPPLVFSSVWKNNLRFLQQQQLYDPKMGCQSFLWNIGKLTLGLLERPLELRQKSAEEDSRINTAQAILLKTFRPLCRYFCTVMLRSNHKLWTKSQIEDDEYFTQHTNFENKAFGRKDILLPWVLLLRKFIRHPLDNCTCARWFLDECLGGKDRLMSSDTLDTSSKDFADSKDRVCAHFCKCWMYQILMECPVPKVRQSFISLIMDATSEISSSFGNKDYLEQNRVGAAHCDGFIPYSPVARVIDALTVLVSKFKDRITSISSILSSSSQSLSATSNKYTSLLSSANLLIWDHAETFRCLRDIFSLSKINHELAEWRYLLSGRGLVRGALLELSEYMQVASNIHCLWTESLILEANNLRDKQKQSRASQDMTNTSKTYTHLNNSYEYMANTSSELGQYLDSWPQYEIFDLHEVIDDDEDFFLEKEQHERETTLNQGLRSNSKKTLPEKRSFRLKFEALNRMRLSLKFCSNVGCKHPLHFLSEILLLLIEQIYIERDHGVAQYSSEAEFDSIDIERQRQCVSFTKNKVSLKPNDYEKHIRYFSGKEFIVSLIVSTPEPCQAFKALRYLAWGNLSNSLMIGRHLAELTIEQTSGHMNLNAIKFLHCSQLFCMLKGDGDFLVQTRVESILPPIVKRINRLIDRQKYRDDAFTHAATKLLLWCITHVPHARSLFLTGDTVNGNSINTDWLQWTKLHKRKRRIDEKERKTKKSFNWH